VSQGNQVRALTQGVDILVATPGRLLDLMQQGHINLRHVEVLVLDEADRMLDMGFIGDIRRIISKLSKQHQTLFFSATMPPEIQKLADDILKNPVYVSVAPVSSTTEQVDQHVYMVDKPNKRALLLYLLSTTQTDRVLVFTRTRSRADMLERFLNAAKIGAEAIHSDKTQSARQRALENFKSGESRVLVATDIASRGIDVEGISHVINFDIPEEPETYVHRIGRTGRAGAVGIALTFCDPSELFYLADIEQVINRQIPILPEHPSLAEYQGPSSSQYGGRGKPGGSRPGRSQSGRSSGSGRPRQEGGGSSQQGGVEAMPNPRRRRRRPKATAAQG
jgi:ATP-dependent RNA helicase RhlE